MAKFSNYCLHAYCLKISYVSHILAAACKFQEMAALKNTHRVYKQRAKIPKKERSNTAAVIAIDMIPMFSLLYHSITTVVVSEPLDAAVVAPSTPMQQTSSNLSHHAFHCIGQGRELLL